MGYVMLIYPDQLIHTHIYNYIYMYILLGGLEHGFYFSIQLGIIIPTDFHIYQSG